MARIFQNEKQNKTKQNKTKTKTPRLSSSHIDLLSQFDGLPKSIEALSLYVTSDALDNSLFWNKDHVESSVG